MTGTLTIVIPTYNEAGNVAEMAKAIRAEYPEFRILFMDDGSTDGTVDIVRNLNDPLTEIRVRE